MADSKITALTSIGASTDPANDPLVLVDVSDTSMAATGTTKKVTLNQLLGASGTATLASATITGDLTVATDRLKVVTGSTAVQIGSTTQTQFGTTAWPSDLIAKANSRVLVGNLGTVLLWNESAAAIGNASNLFIGAKSGAGATTFGGSYISSGIENASDRAGFFALSTFQSNGVDRERYRIDSTGVHTWQYVGGVAGTAMTLNSTGLAIGDTAFAGTRLTLRESASQPNALAMTNRNATQTWRLSVDVNAVDDKILGFYDSTSTTFRMQLTDTGNLGLGVTPSAWSSPYKSIELDGGNLSVYPTTDFYISQNAVNVGGWKYKATGFASQYIQVNSQHRWLIAASGTAGNSITFTQAMTLNAAGSLVLGAAAVATTATDGFLYIPGCAGTPTGTPTAQTGRVPLVVDTTNNKLYFYSGGSWVAAN